MKNRIRPPVRIDENEIVIPRGDSKTKVWKWRLNVPASITGTKKERKFFDTEKEAKTYAQSLLTARDAAGDLVNKLRERGMSVTDAIAYALKHAPKSKPVSVDEAITRFLASRKASNCKPRYIENLESQLKQVSDDFGSAMIDSVNKAQIERFLKNLTARDGETPASPKSRINYLITLTALMNFGVEEGWRGENPAAKITRPNLDETVIEILQPSQVKQLLDEASKPAYSDVYPALLLQLYAGARRSELPFITWEVIRDNYLRLDTTKIRVKRAVSLPANLQQWLALLKGKGRIFAPPGVTHDPKDTRALEDAYTYRLNEIAAVAKLELSKNVLRHTAITYRVASTGDIAATALWAGNSVAVINEHYLGAATKDDAMTFYSLTPNSPTNVVSIREGDKSA